MKRAARARPARRGSRRIEELTRRLQRKAAAQQRAAIISTSRPIASGARRHPRMRSTSPHETGCRLHIVHVSCGRGVALVAEARAAGVDVTCETCPHYLVSHRRRTWSASARSRNAHRRCDPRRSRTSLGAAQRGRNDRFGSFARALVDEGGANFFQVWGGISGCQHLLPLLVDAAPKLAPAEITRLTSAGVAQRFRIMRKRWTRDRKGRRPHSRRLADGGNRPGGVAALSPSPHPLSRPHTSRSNRANNFAGTNNLREW